MKAISAAAPYTKKKIPDWEKLWEGLRRCRSFKSKNKQEMSASEFIIKDRERQLGGF